MNIMYICLFSKEFNIDFTLENKVKFLLLAFSNVIIYLEII